MINLLRTLSLGYISLHRTRTALVVLSIAIGVAAMVATQSLARSLRVGLEDAVNPLAKMADLLVVNGQAGVPMSLAPRILALKIDGIKEAHPFVMERLALADLKNRSTWMFGLEIPKVADASKLLDKNDLGVAVTPLYKNLGLADYAKILAGDYSAIALVTPNLVADLAAHDPPLTKLRLRNAGRTPSFSLAGTVDFSKSDLGVKESSVVVLEIGAASRVAFPEKPGQVQQINIVLEEGADREAVKAELSRQLGDEADVQTPDASKALVADVTAGLEIGIAIGGAGALIVGLFLVYNALAVSVAERRHDIGIMRAVGATRGQIARLFLSEALMMGLAGSLIGLPAGWLMAWLACKPLAGVISDLLVPVDTATVQMPVWLLFAAVGAGTLVTCLASLVPAMQAAGEEPADAVRRVPRRDGAFYAIAQIVAVGVLLGVGLGAVAWRAHLPQRFGIFAGIVCLLLGGLVATPLLAAILGRAIQPLFRHLMGLEGRLAADNLVRAPGRTGLVVAALAATGALLVQTSGFLRSTKSAIAEWVEEKVAADLFVTCGSTVTSGGGALTMREELGKELATVPGVEAVMSVRFQLVTYDNPRVKGERKIVWVAALDSRAFAGNKLPGHPLARGFETIPELRKPGNVAVSENFAALYGIKKGDTIRFPVLNRVVEAKVIGTVVDYTWNRGTILIDRAWFRTLFKDDQADVFDVFLKKGADRAVVKDLIQKKYGSGEAVFVVDQAEVSAAVNEALTRVYAMAYAQQMIVGVVALLGVVSALFISVLQRKRELGLLRAVGATRGQILRSVLAEAVLMGLIGAAVGFVIGLAMEWYVIKVMIFDESGFLFPMRIPWLDAGLVMLGSVALATLAGLWPAYLATTLRIPDAIAYE